MPQNQFDKWLRDKVNPYQSGESLDQEWSMIEARLKTNKKKRPIFLWILTSAALLGLIVIANLTYNNWEGKSDSSASAETIIVPQSVNDDHKRSEAQTQNNGENLFKEKSISAQIQFTNNEGRVEISSQIFKSTNSSITDQTVSKSSNINISESSPNNDPSNNSKISNQAKNKKILLGIASAMLPSRATPDRPLEQQTIAITRKSKGIQWTRELSRDQPSNKRSSSYNSWHLEFIINAGQGFSAYESTTDNTSVNAFENVESAREFVSLDFRAYKGLGKGWWIGSGVDVGYMHIISEQDFIDTVSGALHDQIVKIREDRNGNQVDIIGTTNGRTIYDISRKRHQIHASVSIPVTIKYDHSLNRQWYLSGELGISSTLYNYRNGKSILSNEKDIIEMDLNDRYSMGYRASLLMGLAMNHHLDKRVSLSLGIRGQRDLFGNESMDENWTQKLSNLGLRAGLRYTL